MVKKHKREQRTSKGSRRSSKKVPMNPIQLIIMGKGIYAEPTFVSSRGGKKEDRA